MEVLEDAPQERENNEVSVINLTLMEKLQTQQPKDISTITRPDDESQSRYSKNLLSPRR